MFIPHASHFFKKFIYFRLRWVFVAVCRLSLVVASGGYSSLLCAGFSLWWLLLLQSTGFSSCGTWAQQLWLAGSRAQAQQLWHTGLVAPWHVGSSRTRARTSVPCIGRWILNHCATREAPPLPLFLFQMESLFAQYTKQNASTVMTNIQKYANQHKIVIQFK